MHLRLNSDFDTLLRKIYLKISTMKIEFTSNPSPEDIQILGNGIQKNALQYGQNPIDFFAFFIRDEQKQIIAGCNGCNLYGCLYIDQLWVHESCRNKGYGRELLLSAEKYAHDNGCQFSAVNTMSWEALEFYKKLGYFVEFERKGFEKNAVFYFMRKDYEKN